jgi:hypothetical protein
VGSWATSIYITTVGHIVATTVQQGHAKLVIFREMLMALFISFIVLDLGSILEISGYWHNRIL